MASFTEAQSAGGGASAESCAWQGADGKEFHFATPSIVLNEHGWGPPPNHLPEQYSWLPFAEFGKGDRLGRVADFSRNDGWRFRGDGRTRTVDDDSNKVDDGFQIADTSKKESERRRGFKKRWRGGFRRFRGNNRRRDGNKSYQLGGNENKGRKGVARPQGNWRGRKNNLRRNDRRYRRRGRFGDQRTHAFEDTVKVGAEWDVVEQFELKALTKLSTAVPEDDSVEDMLWCGALPQYDDKFDRSSTRNPQKLDTTSRFRYPRVTARDDDHLQQLAQAGEGDVFATERVLAAIMLSPRSVYPWDIVVTKLDGPTGEPLLFVDKRDDTLFDMLTVNETAQDQPGVKKNRDDDDPDPTSINAPLNLMKEATIINGRFSQQVMNKNPAKIQNLKLPNPFLDDDDSDEDEEGAAASGPAPPCATLAYRYRRWTLPNGVRLVVRCELNGVHKKAKARHKLTCFALNEWDHKLSGSLNWRQKLDSQRGAVLATELKNNSTKLGRWTAQSLLAGADKMLIGYVSRKSSQRNTKHEILGTQFYKPKEFATQINLSQRNMWGILRFVLDLLRSQEGQGKFVLMRDSTKSLMRLYKVPMSTFEDDDDEEDEWDGRGAI